MGVRLCLSHANAGKPLPALPYEDHCRGMCLESLDARRATAAPQADTAQMNAVLVGSRLKHVDGALNTDHVVVEFRVRRKDLQYN